MKLFQICEAKSGYICAIDIYTGKDQTRCMQTAQILDPSCTTTTKLVVGAYGFSTPFGQRALHVHGQLLYKSRTLWGTFFHSTYAYGTVCQNKKGLPKAVTTAKLKKTEAVKWCDKRAVTVVDHNTCCWQCGNKQNWCMGEWNCKTLSNCWLHK